MKHFITFFLIVTTLSTLNVDVLRAQFARDFWLAIPQNYTPNDVAGKVFSLYISSQKNTTVNIQIQGENVVQKSVSANQVLTYSLPTSLEINRSSAVEVDKAVHIWSDDADLNVYFMSRNDFTSDGTVVLPSSAYGKDYVVAAATALYVSASVDLPSEFIVIATEDNTAVTIIPSQDIRAVGQPAVVLHAKGIAFTVFLQKGQCIQYQTTQSQDIPWDLSGSVVTSNNPIAVIGASACPFLPADPYCDHVLEMVPAVDRWGTTYVSHQFADRKYGGDSFLIVASTAGQTILRNGQPYATLGRYETFYRDDITGANVWTSNAPFMLVQYINSATYAVPSGQARNSGDPAMVVLVPQEQYRDSVVFQIPNITPGSGQAVFTSYANIFVPINSVPFTTLDGKLLTSFSGYTQTTIPGSEWQVFRIPSLSIGRHSIVSNTGVTAYAYGYASDDSYAWGTTGAGEVVKVHVSGSDLQVTKDAYIISVDPNPVVSDVQCSFMTTRPMRLSLDIFDVLGKKVRTVIANELVASGKSTVTFTMSDLHSGSYIVRLNADGIISSQMVKLNK